MEKNQDKILFISINNLNSLIKTLRDTEVKLRKKKNIDNELSRQNLELYNNLISIDNVQINLLLSQIFGNILSKEYLYKEFIPSINANNMNKIDICLKLIDNCNLVIEKLNNFLFSTELFDLRRKSLALLNSLYINLKNKLKDDDEKLNKIIELMDTLPSQYYSEAFNDMSSSKELFEIFKSQNPYSITLFEQKFSEVNNSFEQKEIFKKFVELNSNFKPSQKNSGIEIIEVKKYAKEEDINDYSSDFYEKYGLLLIKFCAYHNYIFLDKKEGEKNKEKETLDEENDEDESARIIFLINKDSKESKEEPKKNQRILSLLKNKRFKTSLNSKEYNALINNAVDFYLKAIKNIENEPKIKEIKNHLSYFLQALNSNSYYPLYLKNLDKIVINDNFTNSFVTNVLPGHINKFYFETNFIEDGLMYIEFFLEDQTKDINFELNQYDNISNSFRPIYKEERIDENIRIFLYCHENKIYELVFDNYYSWFTGKDVNFRITYLIPVKDELEVVENIIDIPVIVNLNNLKIVSIKKNENNKKDEELEYNEYKEEDEIISKLYFNYIMFNYFKKQKIDDKKKIKLSIFCQNKDLSEINKNLENKIKSCKNNEEKKFMKILGFIPDDKINDINITYKLYDLDEQLLLNHKLLKSKKEEEKISKEEIIKEKEKKEYKDEIDIIENNEIKNYKEKIKIDLKENDEYNILLIHFSKNIANFILLYKGEFLKKIKLSNSKEINLDAIEINDEDEILNSIKNVNINIKDLEIIFSYDNNCKEENKKRIIGLIEKINKFCHENTNPIIPTFQYEINDVSNNIIKYIYLNTKK